MQHPIYFATVFGSWRAQGQRWSLLRVYVTRTGYASSASFWSIGNACIVCG